MNETQGVAVLVGNGLSIAFNPMLNLRAITAEMMERISTASQEGGDVVVAMKEIAERALPNGVTSEEDFEVLVGAFGAESRTMSDLERLAELTEPLDEELKQAIQRVAKFAEQIRDNGLSHVLEVIFERSHAYEQDAKDLQALVEAIVEGFPGDVVFSNLNYDTLLLSALLAICKPDLADMASGYAKVTVHMNGGSLKVPQLRKYRSDFPSNKRVTLLQLHGSVTFWSNAARTIFAKLDREQLGTLNQWEAIRSNGTNIRPVVVLANQRDKAAHVKEFPFSLAYDMFERALDLAKHWLIVGYSFRDEPVNAKLRQAFAELDPKPRVLVVTHKDLPSRREVARALGWNSEDGDSRTWLTINRDGANGIQDSKDWAAFIAE